MENAQAPQTGSALTRYSSARAICYHNPLAPEMKMSESPDAPRVLPLRG